MAVRLASTVSTRGDIARRMRSQAGEAERDHPGMQVHGHLRDAARQLERGNTEGAERHLRAAVQSLTPLQLVRHGHMTDDEHQGGKEHMAQLTRHLLQVKDVADTEQRNEQYRQNRAAMNAPGGNPIGPPSGTANGPSAQISTAGQPTPARDWRAAGRQSAGPSLIGGATHMSNVELSWRTERRGRGGQWTGGATEAAASGAGFPLESESRDRAGLSPRERQAYDRLRSLGHTHSRAMSALGRAARGLGRALDAGSATEAAANFSNEQDISLSAQTARLASTPRPYGKPGGPGLYNVKGLKHSDYLENIVHALMTKRGFDKGKATAIARGAIRKWMRGGGHVHPEVRAAAGVAEAEEVSAQARARAAHGHSNTGQRELLFFNPNHSPTGQFTTAQGAGQGQGKGSKAHQRQVLTKKIAGLRSQIASLESQLRGMHHSGKSKSSTPRQTGAGATSAKQAAQAKSQAASSKSAASSAKSSSKYKSASQLRVQIAALRLQLRADVAQLRKL